MIAPIDRGVAAHGVDQLASDLLQDLVAEFEYGGVVLADGVVEGEFVVAKTEFGPAFMLVSERLGQRDEFGDDGGGVEGLVLIAQH